MIINLSSFSKSILTFFLIVGFIYPPFTFASINSKNKQINPTPIFDLPVTYNSKIRKWVIYFQTNGKTHFEKWLSRSGRYLPLIKDKLKTHNLPQDLAYMAMIESGLSPFAVSSAEAVGFWQFIQPTANRFGLKTNWWLDERRDFEKATDAAIKYISELYKRFNSWYLVAASYNTGENRVARLMKKYKTTDYWTLVNLNALPKETQEYVPKLLAALIICKAPALYGFNNIVLEKPLTFELIWVPGGTDLIQLADHLNVTRHYLKTLNPELKKGYIPKNIRSHKIRIPIGSRHYVSSYVQKKSNYLAID